MSTERADVPVVSNGTPIMSLHLTNHSAVAAITIRGELDLSTAPLLTDLVARVAAERPDQVIIDMADVTFFGAAGVTALLRANEMITGAGGRLLLRTPSPQTQRVLTITGVDCRFQRDTSDAVACQLDLDEQPHRAVGRQS